MTLREFRNSLRSDEPPEHLSLALAGLWWDAKGDWTRAHESAQQDEGHRRAGKRPSRASPEQEWAEIAESLLRAVPEY